MLVIDKQRVAEWMLLSHHAEQRQLHDRIVIYENKYSQSFKEFEKIIEKRENESFDEWDDYIEWKAYNDFYLQITKKIDDIKSGNFQVA